MIAENPPPVVADEGAPTGIVRDAGDVIDPGSVIGAGSVTDPGSMTGGGGDMLNTGAPPGGAAANVKDALPG